MKITDLSISNRTAIVVLTLALSIGGLVSYVSLPKESQPQIEFAQIIVTTIYPGASPSDVEAIITQEVEREVAPAEPTRCDEPAIAIFDLRRREAPALALARQHRAARHGDVASGKLAPCRNRDPFRLEARV